MLIRQWNHNKDLRSKDHDVYTEEINKTVLSNNDAKDCKILTELHRILMKLQESC